MKKLAIIAALLLLSIPMIAERVTPETARKAATTFLKNNGAKTPQLTDLTKEVGLSNLYIFNAEQGFVVMAADDRVKPILGYSLTNKFVAEGMPENIKSWLQGYNDEIQQAVENQQRASSETAQLWKGLIEGNVKTGKTTVVVGPLIQTQWNQGSPYNSLCPSNSVTGCVATAMAQVMKYWNFPEHGIGSNSYIPTSHPEYGTQSANFNSTTYDWANMTNTYSSSSTNVQKTAVATLMYHCGVSVNMDYTPGSSSAITAFVAEALTNHFGYSSETHHFIRGDYPDTTWIALLKADLDLRRPIQYHGTGSGGGHSFVCDGYDSDNYFHFNWGWGGSCDAYYLINNLNPGPGGIGSGANGIYNNNQGAVFGIHPAGCTAAAPTNLRFDQNGRDIIFHWDAASNAVKYNIFRDNNYLGSSDTLAFIETAPFGIHSYYVRSVDANDELSLSSNSVTVTVEYQTPVVNDLQATQSANDVNLSWTAPAWCYPETPSAMLTYGNGTMERMNVTYYWAHRYLHDDLSPYIDKAVYKVSFFAYESGTYNCFIYRGSTLSEVNDVYQPQTLVTSKTIEVSQTGGWIEIDLDDIVVVDNENDIWVVMNYPNHGNIWRYCATSCIYSGQNNHGNYIHAYNNNDGTFGLGQYGDRAWLIRTYLTDGIYTYNIYQDGDTIAEHLSGTSYPNVSLNNNAANQFTVKTNYYGGESDASNTVGFALGNVALTSLVMSENDKMTVTEGSKLTVSGTLSDVNADNLILENGAQLVNGSDSVKATVKKDIASYSANDDGWNFVASPVIDTITPNKKNGFLNGTTESNTYDLYYYNEPSALWKNYESQAFDIEHQKGYLYANGQTGGTTLLFAGTLNPSNSPITISNLSHSASILNGFNLVGNPFACNATLGGDFYVISDTTSYVVLAKNGREISPCEGVFVKATETNHHQVTFSKAGSQRATLPSHSLDLVVSQGRATLDRARVRFGEGENMEKLSLDDKHTQLTLWQDGKDYSVVHVGRDGVHTVFTNEVPVNFKAKANGTYTLNVENENLELDYLHLIDNLTGNDVDLLTTPNYTFEAKTNDYVSRFRLVFAPICEDADGDNETFAYYSNGEIHLVETQNFASLQMIDMMGRVVVEGDAINRVSTRGMTSGVYVLRVINSEKVRTQKIVIE